MIAPTTQTRTHTHTHTHTPTHTHTQTHTHTHTPHTTPNKKKTKKRSITRFLDVRGDVPLSSLHTKSVFNNRTISMRGFYLKSFGGFKKAYTSNSYHLLTSLDTFT